MSECCCSDQPTRVEQSTTTSSDSLALPPALALALKQSVRADRRIDRKKPRLSSAASGVVSPSGSPAQCFVLGWCRLVFPTAGSQSLATVPVWDV